MELTPAQILRGALTQRISKNPSYSVRAFARDVQVSPAYMSLVLNEKTTLSVKMAIQISNILKWDGNLSEHFIRSVESSKDRKTNPVSKTSASKKTKKKPNHSIHFLEVEADRFRIISDWYHLAILDLSTCSNFRPDHSWIAERLGISVIEVHDAVERLVRLEFLEIKDGCWKKKNSHLYFSPKTSTATIRDHHFQMITKAFEELRKISKNDYEKRSISGVTMAINPKKIKRAFKQIEIFQKKMTAFLTEGDSREVYQLNVQLFPLTKDR